MKTLIALYTILCLVSPTMAFGQDSRTDASQTNLHFKRETAHYLLGNAAALPAYILMMNTMHEGSHAMAAIAFGERVTDFYPLPGFHDLNGQPHFYFSHMVRTHRIMTDDQNKLLLVSPLITDVALFVFSDSALSLGLGRGTPLASVLLFAGMAAPFVDFMVNVNGQSDGNDTVRVAKMSGHSKLAYMLAGDAIALLALGRLLLHAEEIFLSRGQDEAAEE